MSVAAQDKALSFFNIPMPTPIHHTRASILGRLHKILVEQLGVEPSEVILDAYILGHGHLGDKPTLRGDSLDAVELIMEVEDEFEFVIEDEDVEEIKTVQQALDFLAGELLPKAFRLEDALAFFKEPGIHTLFCIDTSLGIRREVDSPTAAQAFFNDPLNFTMKNELNSTSS